MDINQLLLRYNGNSPRYTSFPTAPHFRSVDDDEPYRAWLTELPGGQPISVYLHVPFCRRLCRFCGCHTSVAHHDEPLISYTRSLLQEIALVAAQLPSRLAVSHVHWGGGTPTALPPECMLAIMNQLRHHFRFTPDMAVAFEIDPVSLTEDQLAALQQIGLTRASIGLQDLNPDVQKAIGREQSFEITQRAVNGLKDAGASSINLDLLYGLPYQTVDSVITTAQRALELNPDRLSVFGYAHVPWMKKHQSLLPEAALPDHLARYRQREAIDLTLRAAGYAAIGLDHYARVSDSLAQAAQNGSLRRNFQGYTDDNADTLIGFGASAIGNLPQGYAANLGAVPSYKSAISQGRLPVARLRALSGEDRLRRAVIFRIMCELRADLPAIARAHQADVELLAGAHTQLAQLANDGIIDWNGRQVTVTEAGRPFLRHVAACFDPYLVLGTAKHSQSV